MWLRIILDMPYTRRNTVLISSHSSVSFALQDAGSSEEHTWAEHFVIRARSE
jgi:hypothetical protein